MKKAKKLAVILSLAASMVLASCGNKSTTTQSGTSSSSESSSSESSTTTSSDSETSSSISSSESSSNVPSSSTPPVVVYYKITFKDETGALLKTYDVKEGTRPSHVYEKKDTMEWDYSFIGWSKTLGGETLSELPLATEDVTYFAVIRETKQRYTLTFVSEFGVAPAPITEDYGTSIPEPEKLSGVDKKKFVSWCLDENLTNPVSWPFVLTDNVTVHAKWNDKIDMTDLLMELFGALDFNPSSILPSSLRADNPDNLVTDADIIDDYSSFVNVNKIDDRAYGEQLAMLIDNINQSTLFFNSLAVIEGLTAVSIAGFNNYIDENPDSSNAYEFKEGIYDVGISFDKTTLKYALSYTKTFPVVGEQTASIEMTLNVLTGEKNVRVQLGNPNVLKYRINGDKYEFGIKYLGVRRAYFAFEKQEDGSYSGNIKEILTAENAGVPVEIASAADFYVDDEYVVAVGNKADGMIAFENTISEVYSAKTGRMLGYEVNEQITSPVKIVYDTLWFDLSRFSGINNLKFVEKTSSEEKDAMYVNDSSSAFVATKYGGLSPKSLSRRYDIEFRTRFYNTHDAVNDEYKRIKAQVPMLFVQEEKYEDLVADMKKDNGISLVPLVDAASLEKIKSEYQEKVPLFLENKDAITSEFIIQFIG